MPNDYRRPDPWNRTTGHVPPRAAGHPIVFDSPAELAACTRHDQLAATGPLLLARRGPAHSADAQDEPARVPFPSA